MSSFHKMAFAVGNVVAILLALYIAFARDLERPYWAMFSIFIIARPLTGAVRSKAVYRLAGTLIGAGMAVFLVPPLVHSPELLCVAMALWVGLCVYLAVLDRTPRSYVPALAGYTAVIVGFSVVYSPNAVFDTAVSRVEEIALGIICASLVLSVFFPRNTADELNGRLEVATRSITDWIDAALREPDKADCGAAARRLAPLMENLHTAYAYIPYETSEVRRSGRLVRTLQSRLALLLPLFSGIQAGVAELAGGAGIPASLNGQLERAADAARRIGVARAPENVPGAFAPATIKPEALGWAAQVEQAILVNLGRLLNALRDCRLLIHAIGGGRIAFDARLQRDVEASARRPFHVDHGLALLSAAAAAAAVLIACLAWIGTPWPEGGVAVQFAAIGCSLFAAQDNPARVIRTATLGVLAALPVGALFEFAVLPRADDFVSLALALAPVLLLLSYMQAVPRLQGVGLILAIAFSGSLALQPSYKADFASFVNTNAAEVAGLLIAALINVVFRTIDPAWHALRISRQGWRDVAALARRRELPDLRSWTMRMFDRHGLVTARMPADHSADHAPASGLDGLKDLRVGHELAPLITLRNASEGATRRSLDQVLEAVAQLYDAKAAGATLEHGASLQSSIDDGLAELSVRVEDGDTLSGMTALVGLRLDLGPDHELHGEGVPA